jgi:CheY-like chemotaxis protein
VRALPPDRGGKTPAIAVTALVSPRSVDEALVAGFTTFLTKPYATETVVGAIRELMPLVDELRSVRAGSRATSHLAFREQLRSRRVQLQKRHARVLVANGTEQERHFAMKTLALLTAQDFGETHFCAPLDDVEVAPSIRGEEGSERWVATAVCGQELLTIELVIGPSGDVAVQRMEPVRIVVH